LLCAILARKQLLIAMDLLEKMLDLIIGLATSEPVHQIAVATGTEEFPLHIGTTRWLINDRNALAERSIKELEIRANTGASIISIYRDGANLSNPSPETKLMPGDVVILFGSAEECAHADAFFKENEKKSQG